MLYEVITALPALMAMRQGIHAFVTDLDYGASVNDAVDLDLDILDSNAA